jgi:hypothetical protein
VTSEKLKIPGLAEEARQVNEAIDAEIAQSAKADASRVTQLAELAAAKIEITARLPELEEKALTSDDYALTLNAARSRLSLVESKIFALQGETASRVVMAGAAPLIKKVVAHYIEHLPGVLDDYFSHVASDGPARSALVGIAECTRALGVLRNSWTFFGSKSATHGNRRQFNAVMRRAAAGQFHLLADCQPVSAAQPTNP